NPDLLHRVELSLVHPRAGPLGPLPRAAAGQVALPERPGPALGRPILVHPADRLPRYFLAVQEDAVVAKLGLALLERPALAGLVRVLLHEVRDAHAEPR